MKNYIYIKRYPTKKYPCSNKLLVVGFFKKWFNFKFFFYFNI